MTNKPTLLCGSLTERESALLNEVALFCREEVGPHCDRWEQEESLPREIFKKAGDRGLLA